MIRKGLTWKNPEGKLGDIKRDKETAECAGYNTDGSGISKRGWDVMKESGWSIVPVVMVEIPEANEDGTCNTECSFYISSSNDDYCRTGLMRSWCPGPNCPAYKGG